MTNFLYVEQISLFFSSLRLREIERKRKEKIEIF